MQTKIINTYNITELAPSAKERALDWLREGLNYEWWDFVFEDAKKCASILGIEIDNIYFSGFYSQGDGACFDGQYKYVKGALKAVKQYAPMDTELQALAKRLQDVQRPYLYGITANISCNDRYKRTVGDYDINGRFCDIPDCVIDDMDKIFSEFADWIYLNLEKEWDYLSSEEQLIETAKANDYAFDSEGRVV